MQRRTLVLGLLAFPSIAFAHSGPSLPMHSHPHGLDITPVEPSANPAGLAKGTIVIFEGECPDGWVEVAEYEKEGVLHGHVCQRK